MFNEKKVTDTLKNTLKDFIDMRKTIKKPMTSKALELLINKVQKMATDEQKQIDILNQSIEHGWQTVYPLKNNNTSEENKKKTNYEGRRYEKEELDFLYANEGVINSENTG